LILPPRRCVVQRPLTPARHPHALRLRAASTASASPYEHGAIELLAYRVIRVRGELTPLDHDDIAWVLAKQWNAFDVAPADSSIVCRMVASAQ
jgi:hypothetical protein